MLSMETLKTSKTKRIPKGKILLRYGTVAKYAFKVQSGCLKSYVVDDAGKEHILQFAPEGWLIGDMDSGTNNKPSVIYIDAIEESVVSFIPTSHLNEFQNLESELLSEISLKLRNSLIASNNRIISLLSATAKNRYIEFTITYPSLVQRLPLKLIASYIGITPEYLSDLRRKIAKGQKKSK